MIDEVYRDKDTLEYVIRLNPKLHALFEKDQLGRSGNGSIVARPTRLHGLCGSENQSLRGFKQELAGAFESITHACEAHAQAFQAEIRDNLVHVDRQPSRSDTLPGYPDR